MGHFWPQVWRAFPTRQPVAAPDLILLLLLPLPLLHTSHNKSKASLKSAHQKLLPSHNMSSNGCGQGGLAAKQENSGSRKKGNLRARWPCVFNWLLGKAEKVMCTNQSRITHQSESKFRPPPPIGSRVFVPGSASPGPDRGSRAAALFTKTKWWTGLVADGGQDDNVPRLEARPSDALRKLEARSAARSLSSRPNSSLSWLVDPSSLAPVFWCRAAPPTWARPVAAAAESHQQEEQEASRSLM